jgi:hypothetical protein
MRNGIVVVASAIAVGLVGGLAFGVWQGGLSAKTAVMIGFLGLLSGGFSCLFLDATYRQGPPSYENNWGGLGGGLGGWRMSESLAYMVASLAFGALMVAAAASTPPIAASPNSAPTSRATASVKTPSASPTVTTSPTASSTPLSGAANSSGSTNCGTRDASRHLRVEDACKKRRLPTKFLHTVLRNAA